MSNGTCKVTECDRLVKSRGWCRSHYMFWWQNRVEPSGPVRPWGSNRTQKCKVDGCDNPYDSVGYCAPHYKRFVKYGDPGDAAIKPRSVGDDADYALAHSRVKKLRGPAKRYSCVSCDSPALHWAYDHRDPNEKTDQRGYVYSLDADHYRPMCVPCHKRFDLNHLNGTQFEQFA